MPVIKRRPVPRKPLSREEQFKKTMLMLKAGYELEKERAANANAALNEVRKHMRLTLSNAIRDKLLKPRDAVVIENLRVMLAPAVSERIDARAVYQYVEDEQLDLATFLEAVSITKDAATRLLGSDIVTATLKKTEGSTVDLRFDTVPPDASKSSDGNVYIETVDTKRRSEVAPRVVEAPKKVRISGKSSSAIATAALSGLERHKREAVKVRRT